MRQQDFTILDYSGLIELIPYTPRLITSMNLFTPNYGRSTIAEVFRLEELSNVMPARQRSGERNYVGSEVVKRELFNIPFFPLDRAIQAGDVQNFRSYAFGGANTPKTVEEVVTRTVARIVNYHANLKEKAQAHAIMGTSYAPEDSTVNYNYYDVWGLTQETVTIDFTNPTIDPADVIESEARAHIIENSGINAGSYSVVALCGRKFFQGIINHPIIQSAYQFYQSGQEPLRLRLNGNVNNRMFDHKGVLYIEDIGGEIPTDEAYIFPEGIQDMFQLYYAPADTIEEANQVAQELYLYYKESPYHRERKIESESSFLAVNSRPEAVVKAVGTF